MKNLLIILSAALILVSCGKKNETSSSSKQTSVVEQVKGDTLQPVELKNKDVTLAYKFKIGDKFQYRLTRSVLTDERIESDTTINNQYSQTTSYVFDFLVKKKNTDSTYSIDAVISDVKLSSTFNGQNITYQSNSNLSPDDKKRFIEYETVYNSPFEVAVTDRGIVKDIKGLDKMVDKMVVIQNSKQKIKENERKQLITYLRDAAIKPVAQLVFRVMPGKTLAKDSSWNENYANTLGNFAIDNKVTFKLTDFVKIENNTGAKINASLTTSHSGERTGTEQGINYEFDDPKMSGGGTMIFDIDRGLLHNSETSTYTEIKVKMTGMDQQQKMRTTTRWQKSTNKNIVELL